MRFFFVRCAAYVVTKRLRAPMVLFFSREAKFQKFRRKNRVTRENRDNLILVAINKLSIIFVKVEGARVQV